MSTKKPSEPSAHAAGHTVDPDNQFNDSEPETVEETPVTAQKSTGSGVKPNNQFNDSAPKG